MKQINLIYINNQFKNNLLKTKLNKSISFDQKNNRFWFVSEKEIKSEIKIFEIQLVNDNFDAELFKILSNYILSSLKEIKLISNEPISYFPSDLEKIKAALSSLVFNYSYRDFQTNDIFDFLTDIFIRFLTGHYLKNGNKRFALVFSIQILFAFGYYFKYTKGSKQDYNRYAEKITNFTKELENNRDMLHSNNKIRIKIKKWILRQIILVVPWYNKLYKQFLKSAKKWTKK